MGIEAGSLQSLMEKRWGYEAIASYGVAVTVTGLAATGISEAVEKLSGDTTNPLLRKVSSLATVLKWTSALLTLSFLGATAYTIKELVPLSRTVNSLQARERYAQPAERLEEGR